MGTIRVNGGGAQVVQYRTGSGNKSSRLNYNQSEDLQVNDGGDQLWVDMCFFTCGSPECGPADVLPGDQADTSAGLWRGIELAVYRNGVKIYDKYSNE